MFPCLTLHWDIVCHIIRRWR